MKNIIIVSALCITILSLFAFQQTTEWKAPAAADKLVNPVKGKTTATEEGKKLYTTYCATCHGDKGKGDGPAGVALTPKPGNFSTQKVQAQTDGAIYWKMTNGRPPMVGYKDILKDEQRWQLVNYIRELGKTTTSSTTKTTPAAKTTEHITTKTKQ